MKYVQVTDGKNKQGSKSNEPIEVDDEITQDEAAQNSTPLQAANNTTTKDAGITQENRFQALNLETETDPVTMAMRKEDRQLELEIENKKGQMKNINIEEEESSQESEFVEATQNSVDDLHSTDNEQEGGHHDLAELEKRNKALLDQSWANIAADEEAEKRLLKDIESGDALENPHNKHEFQVVTKKNLKKKAPPKSVYGTRSNTGKSKPFK